MSVPAPWKAFGVRCVALFVLAMPSADVSAQGIGVVPSESDLPITIEADGGIEWKQEHSVVTARGNARAVKGDIEVKAEALSAYYREGAEGETEIWRLEANGDVHISSQSDNAFGQRGVYDVDKAVFVLSGDDGVQFVGEKGTISADDQLEFWERDNLVVARGNARARQGERGVDADVLVAHLRTGADGALELERIEAFDEVYLYTPEEQARADRGIYSVASGLASLAGAVEITRGTNQLRGCRAQVDVTKGLSKLFGCSADGTGPQVRGLIRAEQANGLSTGERSN